MKVTRHLVGAAFVSAFMFTAPAFAVEINQPAPNFTGKTADGQTVTLDQSCAARPSCWNGPMTAAPM